MFNLIVKPIMQFINQTGCILLKFQLPCSNQVGVEVIQRCFEKDYELVNNFVNQDSASAEKSPVFKRACPFKWAFWENHRFFAAFFCHFTCFFL